MKRCSLIIMKTQIKTTMRYHFTSTRWQKSKRQTITVLAQKVEKLESPHIVGMNVKWYSCFGKQCGTELSCDPNNFTPRYIPKTTGIYIYTETCIPMFRLRFFIKAKKWKQVKCPVING